MNELTDKPPFEQYIADYPGVLLTLQTALLQSKLPILEDIACRFMYALELNVLDLKEGDERTFLTDVLVKVTTEMLATIGVLRHGTFIPAYHHTRSMFELYAALEYMYSVPTKKQRRLEKFIEYPNLGKFLHYRELKNELIGGRITDQEFAASCAISEAEFDEVSKRQPEWKRIWQLKSLDPGVVKNWHYPATLENLFQSSEITKNLWHSYENVCHVTHLSPLTRRLAPGNLLIGFPADTSGIVYSKVNMPIAYCIVVAQYIVVFLQSVGAGTIQGVLDHSVEDLRRSVRS